MKYGLFLVSFLFPVFAFASFDVTCIGDSCWTQGWTIIDQRSHDRSEIQCIAENCADNGWIQRFNGRYWGEYSCLEGGCWTKGFDVINRDGRYAGGIQCEEDPNLGFNCLTAGWTIYDYRDREAGYAECIAGDCERFGWDIYYRNGRLEVVRCKDNSCFTNGWTLRP